MVGFAKKTNSPDSSSNWSSRFTSVRGEAPVSVANDDPAVSQQHLNAAQRFIAQGKTGTFSEYAKTILER